MPPHFVYHHYHYSGKAKKDNPEKSQIYPPLTLCPTLLFIILYPFRIYNLPYPYPYQVYTTFNLVIFEEDLQLDMDWTYG